MQNRDIISFILLIVLYFYSTMQIVFGITDYRKFNNFSSLLRFSFGCGMFVLSIFFTTL